MLWLSLLVKMLVRYPANIIRLFELSDATEAIKFISLQCTLAKCFVVQLHFPPGSDISQVTVLILRLLSFRMAIAPVIPHVIFSAGTNLLINQGPGSYGFQARISCRKKYRPNIFNLERPPNTVAVVFAATYNRKTINTSLE